MTSPPENAAELARLLKVIADETRLRILGALAGKPHTGTDLAEHLNLSAPTISHHMRKLVDAGIVTSVQDAQRHWYHLNSDLLLASRRLPISEQESSNIVVAGDSEKDGAFRAKVVRDFFVGDRLRDIPAQRKKRVIVLQHIMHRFDPAQTYTEREINDLLRPAHEDVATLRRELVDYGFMERDKGVYQVSRAGPSRSIQVAQEITGSEQTWLQSLLEHVIPGTSADGKSRSQ